MFDMHRPADAAQLAGEGQEQLVAAAVAYGAGKAVRGDAAPEVAPKLVLDVPRQALAGALCCVLEEGLQVLLDDAVEHSRFRAARLVQLRHSAWRSARSVPRPNAVETPRSGRRRPGERQALTAASPRTLTGTVARRSNARDAAGAPAPTRRAAPVISEGCQRRAAAASALPRRWRCTGSGSRPIHRHVIDSDCALAALRYLASVGHQLDGEVATVMGLARVAVVKTPLGTRCC